MSSLRPGDMVSGKYRIERPLGEGGMGAVYVALNVKLDKRVALKVLRADTAGSPGAAARFAREAIAASRVRHPGVVEVHDADEHEGQPWIAMELLEGESLRERVERGPIDLVDALSIVRDVVDVLAHVHRAGIVHRDLKPDNVFLERLVDGTRRVKLLDFGIASSIGPGLGRVTETGMVIGTPAYLAPEQAAGQTDLDGRVDVYAMGVVLYELIAGRHPYASQSLGEMVRDMYTTGPIPLARALPKVDPELGALVDTCLAVSRDDRVRSAEAFRRSLDAILERLRGAGESDLATAKTSPAMPVAAPQPSDPRASLGLDPTRAAPAPVPASAPSSPGSGTRPAIALAGAALLVGAIAVGGVALMLLRDRGAPETPTTVLPQPNLQPEVPPTAPPPELGDEAVHAALAAESASWIGCYTDAYAAPRPRVPLQIELVVAPSGEVTAAHVTGGTDALRACLEPRFRAARMPPQRGVLTSRFGMTLHD